MSDFDQQLAFLRAQRDAAPDAATRAMYDGIIAELEAKQAASSTQNLGGHAQTGAAVAGGVTGNVVAPLFPEGASGNYIAGVLHVYQQAAAAPVADYDAALKRYLRYLHNEYATLSLRGIDERQVSPPLDSLYISLTLSQPQPRDLLSGARSFMRQVAARIRREGVENLANEYEHRTVEWAEAVRAHPRIAVIGAPGSGKTTLLHFTTIRLAEALARDDAATLNELGFDTPLVPLLLPLREMSGFLRSCGPRERIGTQPRLLLDCLSHYYAGLNLGLPADFFSRLCEEGRALLLLDGLDEVATADERALVSALVEACVSRYSTCRYIVTVRPAAWAGDARLGQRFAVCTVDPLDNQRQQQFIANWSRSIHRLMTPEATDSEVERDAQRFDRELNDALTRNEAVASLVDNPLLLTIVAIVFYNRHDLPENRAALYEASVTVLLRGGRGKIGSAAKDRENLSGLDDVKMPLDEKRELLAAIAYRMHSGGAGSKRVAKRTLQTWASEHLARSYPQAEAERRAKVFIEELPVHLGLLDEVEHQEFGFSHLTFQEFLAARYVAERDDLWDALLDQYNQTWWREVILLCAGYLSQERCWRLLEMLLKRGTDVAERAQALALAADALAELELFKGQGRVREQVQHQALRIFAAPPGLPAAVRVLCGATLASVGDPRPGVCTLPPPMVAFVGSSFMLGSSRSEAEHAGLQWEQYYLKQGDKETAKRVRKWPEREINDQPVTLAPFELAHFPLTNAQYALFIDDDGYNPERSWWDNTARTWLARNDQHTEGLNPWQQRTGKQQPSRWNDARFGSKRTNHPVVGISWYEATAFCRWLTQHTTYNRNRYVYRLPSEAEWERAARGVERREFPWGAEQPDAERANFNQIYNSTTAVGSFPSGATPEGLADMAGNVWEWTASVYGNYQEGLATIWQAPTDVANKRFTLRGGGWGDPPLFLRASDRGNFAPDIHDGNVGFRLARHLPESVND